jgi:antitoxin component YwqK of YwqJK toxin-antitoxin module
MKKLILTIAVALSSLSLVAQDNNNEPTVEFDLNRGLYVVSIDLDNYYHVAEDGTLQGTFLFTNGNIQIKGNMKDGKRHGTLVTYIDGVRQEEVVYSNGLATKYTKHIR